MISDIWEFNHDKLERDHNYIQWLFPLKERSKYSNMAPIVSDDFILHYADDDLIQRNMMHSLSVMLDFYGFEFTEQGIMPANDFEEKKLEWLTKNNHNYLRITRILKSLMIFGMENVSIDLFKELEKVYMYQNPSAAISVETYDYWKKAVMLK